MTDTQKGMKSTDNNSKTEAKILADTELAECGNIIVLSYLEASLEARPV